MSRRDVCMFLTAPARSGKSFNEVRHICDDILPNEKGMIYTNLPLYPDRIAEYVADKYGLDPEDTLSRIHLIPREVESEWRSAGKPRYDGDGKRQGTHPLTGPWQYFEDKPLAGATIIIDEIHNFCGSIGTPKAVSNQWQEWLGELGHNQAIFRCLSQAPEKVHSCIKQEAQASYTIMNTGLEKDPYFKIEIYDWMEIWAGLCGGNYKVFVFEQEMKKVEGRKKRGQRKMHLMGPPYFDFYDSFNAPISGAQTGNVKPFQHEYEKHLEKGPIRGRLSLARWFVFKHFYELSSRIAIVAAIVIGGWWLTNGGSGDVINMVMGAVSTQKKDSSTSTDAIKTGVTAQGASSVTLTGEQVEAMKKAVAEAQAELEKLAADNLKMQQEIERFNSIVLMTPEEVMFAKGGRYRVTDIIDIEGPYRDRKIKAIDYPGRRVFLDSGAIIYMRD